MRFGLRLLASLAVLLTAASAAIPAEAGPSREESLTLQQRLTNAGCYHGAIDGAPSVALDDAVKACPDQTPVLRIETGMHIAGIRRVGVDAACRRLATSSEDKTVRIWSLPEGKLERTIRLPIGEGQAGAASLSPDGQTLAAGGPAPEDSHALYLVDLASDVVRRIGRLPHGVNLVAFSPDGARVAIALGASGLRAFDVVTGAQTLSDSVHDAISLAFDADGVLFATSVDGRVRRYEANGELSATSEALTGQRLNSIAVQPHGKRLAVGFGDGPKVAILDSSALKLIRYADTNDIATGHFSRVAWSRDGSQLVAGGGATTDNRLARRLIRRFDADGGRRGTDIQATLNDVTDIHACGDGFLFASSDPSFGLFAADGGVAMLQEPRVGDMRVNTGARFTVSDDGTRVRFGVRRDDPQTFLFDLGAAALTDGANPPPDLTAARIDGLPVQNWGGNGRPTFAGVEIPQTGAARALAVRHDSRGFALAGWSAVSAFDASGHPLWQKIGTLMAWGANYPSDGTLLLVAYGDGTIRWLRASDGVEMLALFVQPQSRKWVAWTPTGYYMASPGGEDLIGWHLNRGWDQLADFFPASRFSARFNRPDIVKLVLKTRDEAEAVRQANETAKRRQDEAPIAAALPPVVTIVSPQPGASFSGGTVEVSVGVRSPSGLVVDRVDALIDGRPVETRSVAPTQSGPTRKLTIPVPPRDVEISVIARSGELVSEAARVRLTYNGAAPAAEDALKPKLYAVAVGVGDYADETLRLTFPAADARGFADALQKQKGGLYSDVEVRAILDKDATRANVLDALEWLDAAVTSRDIGMVLIAGHGLTDEKGRYWFLPTDAAPKRLGATAVSQEDIRRDMSAIAGKAVLFLDTCHANRAVAARGLSPAGVDVASLVNDFSKTENGLITFAASQGAELSQESPIWGHGAFSLALIEGIGEGKADLLHKGTITVSGLDAYIANRVKELTDGHQHPVMSRPDTVPDFAFATAR